MRAAKETCIALDMNGKRCRRGASRVEQYHGDGEIYGPWSNPWPQWVRAALCDSHCPPKKSELALWPKAMRAKPKR